MPNLNRDVLSDAFDIDTIEREVKELPDDEKGTDEIIRDNINRANRILDDVEYELGHGNLEARMVEVASKLIDSVTNAASQIQNNTYNEEYLLLREKLVYLKQLETESKVKLASGGNQQGTTTNQNIIVTDRQSILDILKGDKQIEKGEKRYDE
jgi:hypothetical protein